MPTENRSSNTEQMVSVPMSTLEKCLRDARLVRFTCDKHVLHLQDLLAHTAPQHQGGHARLAFLARDGNAVGDDFLDARCVGQSLLDLDKPEEALGVFNDILTIDPGHTETLVKKGDTLSTIASRNGTTVSAIKSANRISGTMIRDGQKLIIPKR